MRGRHQPRPRRPTRSPHRLARSARRATLPVANSTSRYLQDGNQIVEEMSPFGAIYATLRQFVWPVPSVRVEASRYNDEPVQLRTYASNGSQALPAGVYYPLQDLLYRTTALTDVNATVVEAYDTDAYGNTLIFSGPGADGLWFTNDDVQSSQPACEYIFTGREYDPESQIYFYRARYYMPGLGRFGGRDPLQSFVTRSLYMFVADRPTINVDPTGLDSVPATLPTTAPVIRTAVDAVDAKGKLIQKPCGPCESPYDKLESPQDICDLADARGDSRPRNNPVRSEAGIICSRNGARLTICVWRRIAKSRRGITVAHPEPPEASAIINDCYIKHEQQHANSNGTECVCDPWRQQIKANVTEKQEELPAYQVQRTCLQNGLAQCTTPDCTAAVTQDLNLVNKKIAGYGD